MWFGTKPIRPTQVGMYRSPSLRGKCTDELFHACGNDSQFCPCWSNGLNLIPHLRGNDFKIAAIVIILCYYFPYMWECFESQGNHKYFYPTWVKMNHSTWMVFYSWWPFVPQKWEWVVRNRTTATYQSVCSTCVEMIRRLQLYNGKRIYFPHMSGNASRCEIG